MRNADALPPDVSFNAATRGKGLRNRRTNGAFQMEMQFRFRKGGDARRKCCCEFILEILAGRGVNAHVKPVEKLNSRGQIGVFSEGEKASVSEEVVDGPR